MHVKPGFICGDLSSAMGTHLSSFRVYLLPSYLVVFSVVITYFSG